VLNFKARAVERRGTRRPSWEEPWYAWSSLFGSIKRGLWTIALVIVPLVTLHYIGAFLYAELHAGHWWWYIVMAAVVIGSNWLLGLSTGEYGFGRKSPPRLLPPGQDSTDLP
jgi:hypothetical protein